MSIADSFSRSSSSTPVTVTACAVFQLAVPNVSAAGVTLAAAPSLLVTCTTTFPVGSPLSRTLYVPLLPSVTGTVLALSTIAGPAVAILTVYVSVMPPDAALMVTVLVPLCRALTRWVAPLTTVVALPPLTLTVRVPVPVGVTRKPVAAPVRLAVYAVVAALKAGDSVRFETVATGTHLTDTDLMSWLDGPPQVCQMT